MPEEIQGAATGALANAGAAAELADAPPELEAGGVAHMYIYIYI